MYTTVVGKIKSWFDLNHDLTHIGDSIQVQKIWFDPLRLEIWFDLLFLEIRFGPKWFGSRIAEFTGHCRIVGYAMQLAYSIF